jgi:mono/diheme cytochrome c family protein
MLVLTALTASVGNAQWLELDVPQRPVLPESAVDAGRSIYELHCWYCHGDEGDGNGPIAAYLWPRPRDFTIGSFKLRTTGSGELPIDEDLFRTISLGLPGTAMPAWQSKLSALERWQVIAYVKTFADGMFEDETFDPYRAVVEVGQPPRESSESQIAAGERVFEESDCWECHGVAGRGDGQKAPDLEDDWGYPLWATDLELGWKFRGGSTARDIYVRLTTGMDGSPMPSYVESLTNEERWQVARYVASLGGTRDGRTDASAVITADRVDGRLPERVDDPRWGAARGIRIPMTGQATFAPRWQVPAVTDLTVRALHDGAEVALLLTWNDRSPDSLPVDSARAHTDGWLADDTYPVLLPESRRIRGTYADAMEVMFPAQVGDEPILPHFVYGDARKPVRLWRWRADRQSTDGEAVVELRAHGAEPPTELAREDQLATGVGVWADGRWSVVIRRPLVRETTGDAGSTAPQLLPIAFHVWDGSHGETGLRMSLSSWYFLYLDEPTRPFSYLSALLAVIAAVTLEYGTVRAMRHLASRGRLASFGVEP